MRNLLARYPGTIIITVVLVAFYIVQLVVESFTEDMLIRGVYVNAVSYTHLTLPTKA